MHTGIHTYIPKFIHKHICADTLTYVQLNIQNHTSVVTPQLAGGKKHTQKQAYIFNSFNSVVHLEILMLSAMLEHQCI